MKLLRILFLVITFLAMHLTWKNDNNFKLKSTVKGNTIDGLTSTPVVLKLNESPKN